ncbi:actin-like ATPase domain-containing protein [Cercophora scortea]|uniref:Phosphotransferase n=1 Tax=Cercophora scortea TaxID=314031 RepID=A0AAE0IG21_9PEZI|nr:actin-like ATPase domain-containing protein [Cercophora scortea]
MTLVKMPPPTTTTAIADFLKPLDIDSNVVWELSRELASTFKTLSAESLDQFLPTPISESILRPAAGLDTGRFLAIDIGGTNLRVAFVELLHDDGGSFSTGEPKAKREVNGFHTEDQSASPRRLNRLLEHSWPINDHLKNENSESLFAWIGDQVAHVVRKACDTFELRCQDELPMGVTFSFPMKQSSLSEATLMAMGKGFAITSNLDLGGHLLKGYERHRTVDMPPIKIAAISNDAVSTLVSFVYQYPAKGHQKAAMGVIVGTGCNATIPLKLSSLHASKRPVSISVLPDQDIADVKIAVNTEWSINGSAPPLRKFGLISRWDELLDKAGEAPGFQPLEYMTAGRYLGELARLIFVDYMTTVLGLAGEAMPEKLQQRFGLTTTFISHFYPGSPRGDLLEQLEREFPLKGNTVLTQWTEPLAHALYSIAHAIEVRAAGIVAASTVGLLSCAEEIPLATGAARTNGGDGLIAVKELAVGYTGGCIQYFQNYLADTQKFIDEILDLEFAGQTAPIRVTLSPCHDGGITGAGILVPAALGAEKLLR